MNRATRWANNINKILRLQPETHVTGLRFTGRVLAAGIGGGMVNNSLASTTYSKESYPKSLNANIINIERLMNEVDFHTTANFIGYGLGYTFPVYTGIIYGVTTVYEVFYAVLAGMSGKDVILFDETVITKPTDPAPTIVVKDEHTGN